MQMDRLATNRDSEQSVVVAEGSKDVTQRNLITNGILASPQSRAHNTKDPDEA